MTQDKIDLLNSLNFKWIGDGIGGGEIWEANFEELKLFLQKNNILSIKTKIGNKSNPLYLWFNRQKKSFKKENYDSIKIEKFLSIGIDLMKLCKKK